MVESRYPNSAFQREEWSVLQFDEFLPARRSAGTRPDPYHGLRCEPWMSEAYRDCPNNHLLAWGPDLLRLVETLWTRLIERALLKCDFSKRNQGRFVYKMV